MFKFSTIKFNATDADMVNMINSVLQNDRSDLTATH